MSDIKAIRRRDAQITHHNLPPMPTRDPDPFAPQALRDMAIEGAHDRRALLQAIDQVLTLAEGHENRCGTEEDFGCNCRRGDIRRTLGATA